MLPGTLLWLYGSISLSFLVNFSADDCFIDQDLAKESNISIKTLANPNTVLDLDGKTFTKVTHRTAPLAIIVSGNCYYNLDSPGHYSSYTDASGGSPWP